jgi:hypothetical protein
LIALALVLNDMSEKLGYLKWWWLGVFIAPTTKPTVGEAVCRWAHRTVWCTSHVTQPLGFWRFRPLELWHLGAPDRHCSLSGALLALLWLCANCPRTVHVCKRPLELTVALDSRCSAGTPDSPMTHRTVRWIIVERLSRNPKVKSLSRSPLVHRTVWCARPGFSSVSFAPLFWTLTWNFLLVCVEPLASVEYTI